MQLAIVIQDKERHIHKNNLFISLSICVQKIRKLYIIIISCFISDYLKHSSGHSQLKNVHPCLHKPWRIDHARSVRRRSECCYEPVPLIPKGIYLSALHNSSCGGRRTLEVYKGDIQKSCLKDKATYRRDHEANKMKQSLLI